MDWITDHIQLVIAAAAAFAYWLNARKQQAEEDDEPNARQFQDESQEAAEEAESARRIREEIRRKITERSSGGGGANAPRPVASPPPLFPQREIDPPVFAPEPPRQPMIDTAVLEQQRRLQEQLEEAARTQRRAQEIRRAIPTNRNQSPITAASVGGRGLRADLQSRTSLRRAIVLREVLGPPVGLR